LQVADAVLEAVAPVARKEMIDGTARHNRLGETAFSNFVFNATCTDIHLDWNDKGCCVLIFFGPARFIMFPEIGTKILVRHGDVIVFPSHRLWHCSGAHAENEEKVEHTTKTLVTAVFYCDSNLGDLPLRPGPKGQGFEFLNDHPSTWVSHWTSRGGGGGGSGGGRSGGGGGAGGGGGGSGGGCYEMKQQRDVDLDTDAAQRPARRSNRSHSGVRYSDGELTHKNAKRVVVFFPDTAAHRVR
jgi:uncharacterized membrane protein YgcG